MSRVRKFLPSLIRNPDIPGSLDDDILDLIANDDPVDALAQEHHLDLGDGVLVGQPRQVLAGAMLGLPHDRGCEDFDARGSVFVEELRVLGTSKVVHDLVDLLHDRGVDHGIESHGLDDLAVATTAPDVVTPML